MSRDWPERKAGFSAGSAVLALFTFGFWNTAHADGPHIAFHGTQGAYTVTLFSAPDPLVAGPAVFTLLVQNASDGALTPLAKASGRLTLVGRLPIPFMLVPRGGAGEQTLSATVPLPDAGQYALMLQVGDPGRSLTQFKGVLPVEPNHGQRNTVLWAVFLPLALIVLFLANQYAKAQLRRR